MVRQSVVQRRLVRLCLEVASDPVTIDAGDRNGPGATSHVEPTGRGSGAVLAAHPRTALDQRDFRTSILGTRGDLLHRGDLRCALRVAETRPFLHVGRDPGRPGFVPGNSGHSLVRTAVGWGPGLAAATPARCEAAVQHRQRLFVHDACDIGPPQPRRASRGTRRPISSRDVRRDGGRLARRYDRHHGGDLAEWRRDEPPILDR